MPVLQRVGVGHQVSHRAVGVDEFQHPSLLRNLVLAVGGDVDTPAQRLVRDTQGLEDLVVEALLPEQQLVDDLQELARLGTLDHAVVIGGGERRDLGDAEVVDVEQRGPLELRGIVDVPDTEDHSLTVHQPGHGVIRPDAPGIGDGGGGTGEIGHRELPGARLGDDLFVVCPELREIELFASLDVGNQELAGAIRFLEVDGDSQVDRGVFDQRRLAVDDVVGIVHRGHGLQGLDHRVGDQMGEADLAALGGFQEVVDPGALIDHEFHGHGTHGCGGGHAQ